MLSPHELATLMLIKNAPGRIEPDREELWALRDLHLVIVDTLESGFPTPRVTPQGDALLKAVARMR